jgi:hypothetical protein
MLPTDKYSREFQMKAWATRYHIYSYIKEHGKLKALQVFPFPFVEYFVEWEMLNKTKQACKKIQ